MRKIQKHDDAFITAEGYVLVLPKFEPVGVTSRIGQFMLLGGFRKDSFRVGVQFLGAGVLLELGPFYVGICHIQKQLSAFDHKDNSHD